MRNSHSVGVGYILWLFGFLGAHRFYFGRPITGLLWFFTCGLFGVGWLVDLFLIPSMDREADQYYVEGKLDYSTIWIVHIYLGFFGVHRFMMGKPISGLIYLLTFGLCGVGYLYDCLTLNEQINEINADS